MLNIHWKNWYWGWSSNTLATWCEEPTNWKWSWCWERLRAGEERDERGWDGWMASLTQWAWVWANSGRWWRTGSLACRSSWGHKQSDKTGWLNSKKKAHHIKINVILLEDDANPSDHGFVDAFLGTKLKTWSIKEKTDMMYVIKLKTSALQKTLLIEWKDKPQTGK